MPINPISLINKLLLYIALILSLVATTFAIYIYLHAPKIAYVRSLELVYSFNGMRQAHSEYKSQTDTWQKNLDTLRKQYDVALANYKMNESKLNKEQKESQQKEIIRLETTLRSYSNAISKEAKDKEQKLTEAVLNQVNSFIENYAKKKGFDIVLGAQGNGSVLYGTKTYDITNEVIEEMNKEYKILPDKNIDSRN